MDDMVMLRHIMRTRFLGQLDEMLRQDRRGAIDDMLQVLRERGAIKTATATVMMHDTEVERWGEDFVSHMKHDAAVMLGCHLYKEGKIVFKTRRSSMDTAELIGEITVVVGR